jgi:propanediol dehydratase large subunit
MLEFSSVFFIFERLGLDVVTSEEFKNAVYKKAEKDTRYWLLNAPMS